MKVLFIIPNLTFGGIQTQVTYLSRHLSIKGCRVRVIGLHSQDYLFANMLRQEGVEVQYLPHLGDRIKGYPTLSFFKKLKFWYDMVSWLRDEKPDVLLPYTLAVDDVFNVIWRLSGAIKSFSFERGGYLEPKPQRNNWLRKIKKYSKPIYVSNSLHGAKALSVIRGIELSKIHVIRNAYVPPIVEPSKNSRQWRKEWEGKVVFTCIANFFNQKDHTFLLEAWRSAKLERSVLLLVGMGGTSTCRDNYQQVCAFIDHNELNHQVFLLGSIDQTYSILEKSDVGVLSSTTEGCPNAVLEYMGAALPVMSRNIPGVYEIVSEPNRKILTGFHSISDYAQMLQELEKNERRRKFLGEVNREHVFKEFKLQTMLNAYEKLILV